MSRARGHNADITQLRYASGTETIDGKKVGYADITANYAHRLTIYTDPAVPTEGRNWKSETWRGWFGKGHWEKANPRNVLDDIGYEARNY